jgi:hypothetical protein
MSVAPTPKWARRLTITCAACGIGSFLGWWTIDGDVYTDVAYNSSFGLSESEAWDVLVVTGGLGLLSIITAIALLFLRRSIWTWMLLVGSLILPLLWYYEVNQTAMTTTPAVLQNN